MAAFAVTNASGTPYNMDINAVGANYAPTVVWADQNGNKVSNAPGLVALPVQAEGVKSTYVFASLSYTPVATPTDVVEIKGSATKTVRIRRIRMGGVATAAGNMPIRLIRRSAASTGGGSVLTALTAFKPDTAYAAATATVGTFGTANPTVGAVVGGDGGAGRAQLPAVSSGVAAVALEWKFDVNAIVLRGIAEFLYISMNGAALPAGAVFDVEVELQEDGS